MSKNIKPFHWKHRTDANHSSSGLITKIIERVTRLNQEDRISFVGTAKQISTTVADGKRTTEFQVTVDLDHPVFVQRSLISGHRTWRKRSLERTRLQRIEKALKDLGDLESDVYYSTQSNPRDHCDKNLPLHMFINYMAKSHTWCAHLTPLCKPEDFACFSSPTGDIDSVGSKDTSRHMDTDSYTNSDAGSRPRSFTSATDGSTSKPVTSEIGVKSDLSKQGTGRSDGPETSVYWNDGTVWNLTVYDGRITASDKRRRGPVARNVSDAQGDLTDHVYQLVQEDPVKSVK